ncbi:E3 ubiquitin-protein ligase SINA-like 10 [Senna tora]|uniref:E3 ubiquitin-protein ligase SINA-like 10 n=1 Tax=Senna tora TaxID=362788 RepID=A0A835C8K3_9FABA|nr:E3 ubiquitin-protein ligase SINA-like 10 [Senna tora]
MERNGQFNEEKISNKSISVIVTDPKVLACVICFKSLRAPIYSTLRFAYDESVSVSFNSDGKRNALVLREGSSGDLFVVVNKNDVVENVGHVVYVVFFGPKSREERFYSVVAKSSDSQRNVSFFGWTKNIQAFPEVDPTETRDVLIPSSFLRTCGRIEVEVQIKSDGKFASLALMNFFSFMK